MWQEQNKEYPGKKKKEIFYGDTLQLSRCIDTNVMKCNRLSSDSISSCVISVSNETLTLLNAWDMTVIALPYCVEIRNIKKSLINHSDM